MKVIAEFGDEGIIHELKIRPQSASDAVWVEALLSAMENGGKALVSQVGWFGRKNGMTFSKRASGS